MYYYLQTHCQLVKGANRAAIYDFKTSKVHSINMAAAELVTACANSPLEELWNTNTPSSIEYTNFLEKLNCKELGYFSDTKLDTTLKPSPPTTAITLDFIWLELTSACNCKCLHCYAECSPSSTTIAPVSHERWLTLIMEGKRAGANAIQLIGGEPLLYPNWRELIIKASELGYEYIEIFTNGTLVDEDSIEFFKKYHVNIATTIYADNALTHDKITRLPNSFNKTMATIKKIMAANIPIRIASIIMKANEHEVENIKTLYKLWGMPEAHPDVVRPTGRGDDQSILPLHYHKPPITPPFYIDEDSFLSAHLKHPCLAGKIAITATGDVFPCIFARNQLCGNIVNQSLDEILKNSRLTTCWQTTKDSINKCKDCEYRYACFDCRPLAQGSDPEKNWSASPQNCSYNPYTGQWDPHPFQMNKGGL